MKRINSPYWEEKGRGGGEEEERRRRGEGEEEEKMRRGEGKLESEGKKHLYSIYVNSPCTTVYSVHYTL